MEPGQKEMKIWHVPITLKKIQEKKSNVGTLLTKLRNKRRATKQSKCEKTEGEEMKKRNAIVKNREGEIKSAGTVTSGAIEGKAGRMAGKRRGNLNLQKGKEDEQEPYQRSSQRKCTANNREKTGKSESSPKVTKKTTGTRAWRLPKKKRNQCFP